MAMDNSQCQVFCTTSLCAKKVLKLPGAGEEFLLNTRLVRGALFDVSSHGNL